MQMNQAPSGATSWWPSARTMPPRWGWILFWFWFYKYVAPDGAGERGLQPASTCEFRGRWKMSARAGLREVKRRERRAPGAECGRPRPLPCPNGDARSPVRGRLVLPRCSARGRAHSGDGCAGAGGENGRAGRGQPPLPKSVWDGRTGQRAFECHDCLKVKI
jgi:hypothetical protein